MASAAFSSDGASVAFLKTVKSVSTLALADTATGSVRLLTSPDAAGDTDANLTLEEKLRRERSRQLSQGVTSFTWLPHSTRVVFPRGGSLVSLDTAAHEGADPVTLFDKGSTGAEGSALDPKPSPDGSLLAFVQQDELYVVRVGGDGGATRLTYGARPGEAGPGDGAPLPAHPTGVHHGVPDFVTAEEFDRQTGYWWSPCGRYIAFQETDERHVPLFRILHSESADPHAGEAHAYPFAGQPNPRVRMGVVDVHAALATPGVPAPVLWLDTGREVDMYVPRLDWVPVGMGPLDGGPPSMTTTAPHLLLQVMNRKQNVLDLVLYNVVSGHGVLVLREVPPATVGDVWVNVSGHLECFTAPAPHKLPGLPKHIAEDCGGFFLWGSERSGFNHVYVYAIPAKVSAYEGAPAYTGPPPDAKGVRLSTHGPHTGMEAIEDDAAGSDAAFASLLATAPGGLAHCLGCVTGRPTSSHIVEGLTGVAGIPGDPYAGPALYFLGSLDSPLEKHLYAVPIFRSEWDVEERVCTYGIPGLRRLTSGPGMHGAVLKAQGGAEDTSAVLIADALSSLHAPPSLSLLRFDPSQRFSGSPARRALAGGGGAGGAVSSPAGLRSPSVGASSSGGVHPAFPHGASSPGVKGGASPLGRVRSGSSASFVQATESDVLLAPLEAPSPSLTSSGEASPFDISTSVVRFEGTGGYGGRMAAGVAFVGVLAGALPTGSPGTPAHHASLQTLLADKYAAARRREEEDGDSRSSGASAMASVSRALDGLAAVMQSGMTRLDTFGEKLAAQLQGGMSLPSLPSMPTLPGRPRVEGTSGGAAGSMTTLDGLSEKFGKAVAPLRDALRSSSPPQVNDGSDTSAPTSPRAEEASVHHASPAEDGGVAAPGGDARAPASPAPGSFQALTGVGMSTPVHGTRGGIEAGTSREGEGGWSAATPEDAGAAAAAAKANPAPLIFRLPAADGRTPLFAALFVPDPAIHGPGPWPLLLSVYGGPHVQRVKADWALASEARSQQLRRDGFLVLAVDNRGSSRRGLAFEACLHRRMGSVEVDDQAAAVRTVLAAGGGGVADAARVGVFGWSYGGYMTLQCLAQHPSLFHAGVAGAPVTFWEGYDTGYTERYMGTPDSRPGGNKAGYDGASVLRRAGAITGRLLLIHGLLDENVHARHSVALVAALTKAGVPHDTLFLPGERHVVRAPPAKAYMDARLKDHFHKALGAGVAAPGPVQRIVVPAGGAGVAAAAAATHTAPTPVP